MNGNYEPGNVRWASYTVQGKNGRMKSDNTSGHTGVSKGRHKSWRAYYSTDGVRHELGEFPTIAEAVHARHLATINDPAFHCCEELEAMRARQKRSA